MVFYVDFDDCLCETAKSFTEIAARLFDKKVPYENFKRVKDWKSIKEYVENLLGTNGHQ